VLHLHDHLDGIQIDAFTSIGGERSFQCLGNLLAKILADVLCQCDRDPLISGWPTLASARTTQLTLVDHLEGTDLRV
jgi:hypothetical protein